MECSVGYQMVEEECKGVCGYVQEVKGYKGHDKEVIRIRKYGWCFWQNEKFCNMEEWRIGVGGGERKV